MTNQPPDFDPIAVWQNTREHSAPSLEELMDRANQLRERQRRDGLIFVIAFVLHLVVSLGEDFLGIEGNLWWVGVIRFALLLLWITYIPFPIGSLDNPSLTVLRIAGTTPVVDFYRSQLLRRRDYFRDDNRRVFQWIGILGGSTLYSILYPRLFVVFAIPLAVGATLIYRRRQRELPEIQRELDELERQP